MLIRAFEFLCFAALFAALSIILQTPHAFAASDMVWSFSEGNDASNRGRMTARLGYGVPETDNVQVDGVCEARRGTGVMSANLILGAEVGKLEDGSSVNVRFTGGGFNHFVSGSVYGTKLEEGITGISLDVKVNDPLWKALMEQDSLDYLVPGYSASKLALKGGQDKIRQFIRACRSYADVLGPEKTSEAKPASEKTVKANGEPKKTARYQTASGPEKKASPSGGASEKEAYDAAKELGTLEAWEAFLNNFPKGFRADLARAYVKRLGNEIPRTAKKPAAPPAPKVTAAPIAPAPPPPPPGPADISITQTANQGACKGGDNCSYTTVATNTGGTLFTGQLVIANSLAPRGATLTSPGSEPWFCQGMGGGAVCTNAAANLAPGASTTLSLTFTLPRNAGGSVTSCASISWGGAPTGSSVRDVQAALAQRGFNPGPADGQAGRKTVNAIREFQGRNGLQASGKIDLPLLIALFTTPRAGDANPGNDQACAGSAVTPAPTVFTPAPPAARWQPPRGQKAVTRKSPTGKCSSRSVWLEGQCILKSYVASFCGPGFHRAGSKCVSNANRAATAPRGDQRAGCPSGQTRVGNSCVNTKLAPVFGNAGRGGDATTRTGGGQPFVNFNRSQFGGPSQTKACLPGKIRSGNTCKCPPSYPKLRNGNCYAVKDGNEKMHPAQQQLMEQQQIKAEAGCPNGEFRSSSGQCTCGYFGQRDKKTGKCTAACFGGMVPAYGDPMVSCKCPAGLVEVNDGAGMGCARPGTPNTRVVPRKSSKCPDPRMILTTSGKCHCGDFAKVGNKCVTFSEMKNYRCIDLGLTDAQATNPNIACKPSGQGFSTNVGEQICGSGQIIDNAGRCTCPQGKVWRKGRCRNPKAEDVLKQLFQPQNQNAPATQPRQQFQQQITCTGGRVANANGQCKCTGGKVWRSGKCRNPKAQDILKQFIQPKPKPNQPKPQPNQPQNQNQQLQQGINNLLNQFSDARLKRDVTHLATMESGIRLYAFRYLWEDTLRVGVMAQDLLANPVWRDAVILHPSGYYAVDYAALGLRMVTLEDWNRRGSLAVRLQPSTAVVPANAGLRF